MLSLFCKPSDAAAGDIQHENVSLRVPAVGKHPEHIRSVSQFNTDGIRSIQTEITGNCLNNSGIASTACHENSTEKKQLYHSVQIPTSTAGHEE